jgi:hypothetical protein
MLEKKPELYSDILNAYSREWRTYHNLDHVVQMLRRARELYSLHHDYHLIQIAIVYHDIVYDTQAKGMENEKNSVKVFAEHYTKVIGTIQPQLKDGDIKGSYDADIGTLRPEEIVTLYILNTAMDCVKKDFQEVRYLDRYDLIHGDYKTLYDNDIKIVDEYGVKEFPENFRKNRKEFLLKMAFQYNNLNLVKIANLPFYN